MMNDTRSLLAIAAAAMISAAAAADEVTAQIDTAKKAYEAGELRSAVEALNFAVAKIQEEMTANLLTLLPEPLRGWQADAPTSQSGGMAAMITGTTLARRYFREDGAEVSLSLMADSPMMPMMTMAMSMPFVMQGSQDMKTYSFKGHRGMIDHAAGSEDYQITLMVGNRLVIQVKGGKIPDPAPLEAYLNALDLAAIQKAMTH